MTDVTTNARFTDLGNGMQSELIANQVQLFYDPTTGAARATFNGQQYLDIAGTYRALGPDNDMLQVDLGPRMLDCYGEGISSLTGVDLSQICVADFMSVLKSAYDKFVQERAVKIAADMAAAEAAAARAAALSAAIAAYNSSVPSPSADGTVVAFQSAATGLSVAFTDQSTDGTSQLIVAWSWIFGDGAGSSTEQNPTYEYKAPGTYTVSLVVTDASGTNVNTTATVVVG